MTGRELHWTVNGEDVAIRLEESVGKGTLHLKDETIPFLLLEKSTNGAVIEINGQMHRVYFTHDRRGSTVWWRGIVYRLDRSRRTNTSASIDHLALAEIRAPMPGKILRLEVQPHSKVESKQALLVMESMKMETTIPAPKSGTVTGILVKPGQVVEMNELLMKIE